ncbi:MAG: flagellar filament capping protein FliD [Oscillospiraceae bacterium]|nr:flagellar filament capping protein FliD [Oscillospiraceae bacterium]
MVMSIGSQGLYDKMVSGTLTRKDYVRAQMARSLSRHNKLETEALKVKRRLELENELKESLASIAESYANVQSLCESFKTAKSSDETVIKFLDGNANIAKDLTIKVNQLSQKAKFAFSRWEMNRVQQINGKITENSLINNGAVVAQGTTIITFNGTEIKSSRPDGQYTIANLMADINSHTAETGVTAYFNSVLGRVVLEQDHITQWVKTHGDQTNFVLSNLLSTNQNEGGTVNISAEVEVKSLGIDVAPADYTLDGDILEIGGARFKLLKAQEDDDDPCTFEATNGDADKVANGVENFVGELNTFLKRINKLYTETPDQKAELPTVEERESMTDEELTKREEKVCKGIFYHNHELRELAINAGNIIKDLASNMPGLDIWSTAIGLRGTNEDGRLLSIQLNKTKLATALTNGVSQGVLKLSTDEVLKMLSGAKTEEYSGGFLTRFAALCAEQKDSYTQLDARGIGTARKHAEAQQKLQDSLAAIEKEEKRIVEQYNKRQAKIEAMETQMFYLTSSWDAIMEAQYN